MKTWKPIPLEDCNKLFEQFKNQFQNHPAVIKIVQSDWFCDVFIVYVNLTC